MIKLKSKISKFEELKQIDKDAFDKYKYLVSDTNYEILDKNVIYFGFGILLTNKGIYILVAEKDDDYVTLKPLALFNIIEYSIPDFWVFCSGNCFNSKDIQVYKLYTFREWCQDERFYEKLITGDDKSDMLFRKFKKIISNTSIR